MHYANTNTHDNTDCHANGYFDGDANGYSYPYSKALAYTAASTNSAPAPVTKKKDPPWHKAMERQVADG